MTIVDWTNLKAFIGDEESANDQFIQQCWTDAQTLLTLATANAFRPVPQNIFDRMALEVGHELYKRKDSPSGNSQYAVFDGGVVPVRGPRDPLAQVRPILAMYVVPF